MIIIYGSSNSVVSRQISKLVKKGEIRKISPRVYTSNLDETPEVIVRRNLFSILGYLFPEAVLSYRSAFEFKPTKNAAIYLTYTYTKKVELPGVTVHLIRGKKSIEGDNLIAINLYVAQSERAFLENLQSSRISKNESKSLPISMLEERLEKVLSIEGEIGLNRLRNQALKISKELNLVKEYNSLTMIISALLSTHSSKILKSPVATARALGVPYDASRIQLFEILFNELTQFEFQYLADHNSSKAAFRDFAFFESYFSNYIEGTIFELDQAKEIIENQSPISLRYEDSHDVLGTYNIISNKREMRIVPTTGDELLFILQNRHQILLSSRDQMTPGVFKNKNNRAGNTSFVDYKLVRGTLLKSFDLYHALSHPFSKAVYMMFVISEIHPFLDGNGRIARVMMNAELVSANQSKIIIPNSYREDYILSLRKLTRQQKPEAFVRMLLKIRNYSNQISGSFDEMKHFLDVTNAFHEPSEGKLIL